MEDVRVLLTCLPHVDVEKPPDVSLNSEWGDRGTRAGQGLYSWHEPCASSRRVAMSSAMSDVDLGSSARGSLTWVQNQGTAFDVARALSDRSRPVVCHATAVAGLPPDTALERGMRGRSGPASR